MATWRFPDRKASAMMVAALMLLAALAAPVLAQQAPGTAIGPYVQNVGKDNATICWATRAGQVDISPAAKGTASVRGYEHHSVILRNLKPATTYTYDLLGDGSDATLRSSDTSLRSTSLGKGAFTTTPDGDQPFTFAVIGDSQGDQQAHRRIVERVIPEKPDLVFNTGDLTGDGDDMGRWENFFRVSADLMRSIPYYPAYGNHEHDSPYYLDFFSLPGIERYYSFDRGSVHFVVLDSPGLMRPDTNQADNKELAAAFGRQHQEYWDRQMAWLKDDLAGHQDARFTFVFFHYPLYTVNDMPGYLAGAKAMREAFGNTFQGYGVTAVFNGHDHQYHHALAGGVHFIVAGPAGGDPRPIGKLMSETVQTASGRCFVRVAVTSESATVRIIGIEGNTVDEFQLKPRARPASQ